MKEGVGIGCLLLAAMLVAGCANERPAAVTGQEAAMSAQPDIGEWPEESGDWADCPLTIQFGSFAVGPDRKAAAAIDRLLRSDESASVTRSPYGREGEYSLCVRTSSKDHAVRLFEAVREILRAGVRAPVSVKGPFESFSAPAAGEVPVKPSR